jgi:hypothetical protein
MFIGTIVGYTSVPSFITQKITYTTDSGQKSVDGIIYDETDDFIYYLKDKKSGNKWNAIKKDKIISIEAIGEEKKETGGN